MYRYLRYAAIAFLFASSDNPIGRPVSFPRSFADTGYTPEVGGSATAFGVDGGGYPMPVVYTLGFNLSF